ncbi:MAG: Elongation factor Ts [Chlamydiales bacterium]|nr:Elongation factor Ts [Chlamydiales bacterium]
MTQITPQMLKQLRDRTGIGMGKCKEALQESGGDVELAIANLRKAGMASAVKKEGRETNEGVIRSADNGKTVALVEVNAETDFVVNNERFQEFAANLAQEVCQTQPANVEDFLAQSYSKDGSVTIDQYRATIVQSLGENIQIRRIELFPKKAESSLAVYTHAGGKLVTLVEVSGSNEEEALAKDIAMHVAAEAPEYLSAKEIPERVIEHEKEIAKAQVKNKPENIIEKILEGKLRAYFDQVCLLNQHFVKNPDLTIQALVEQRGKECGKSLVVSQFLRWRVGE